MFIIDCVQGSDEWLKHRLGKATASRFKDLLSQPKAVKDRETGKLSATARSYMLELVAETLTEESKFFSSAATQWGNDNEDNARDLYEFMTNNTVEQIGMATIDELSQVGASPDGLIGDDGGIEIKCPYNSAVHVDTLLSGEMPKEHMAQVQGCMWVTGCKWWDFVSYDPRINDSDLCIFIKRIERDEEYISTLKTRVLFFADKVESTIKSLRIK